jgi:hypothetical protein
MTIGLECINLIIPIALIEKKHPGGWQSYLDENPGLPSDWHDEHLLRLGAMNQLDIRLLLWVYLTLFLPRSDARA